MILIRMPNQVQLASDVAQSRPLIFITKHVQSLHSLQGVSLFNFVDAYVFSVISIFVGM